MSCWCSESHQCTYVLTISEARLLPVTPSRSRVVRLGGSFAGMSSSRVQYMTLRGTNPTKLPMPCTTCLSTTKSVGQQSCRVYGSNQVHGSRGPRSAHPSVSFLSFPFATSRSHAFFQAFHKPIFKGLQKRILFVRSPDSCSETIIAYSHGRSLHAAQYLCVRHWVGICVVEPSGCPLWGLAPESIPCVNGHR